MKRIGIIGVGNTVAIGGFHEKGIRNDPRCTLTAVFGRDLAKAEKWICDKKLEGCKACDDIEEFYSLVDAVIICTPTATHLEYVKSAVAHGVDFLCEKPLGAHPEKWRDVLLEIERKKIIGFVGFIYRSAKFTNKIKDVVEKRIGKVYTYTCHYGGKRLANPQITHEWRFSKQFAGSGAVGDFGSHVIDTAIYCCGLEFAKVSGFTNTFIKKRRGENGDLKEVDTDDSAVFNGICKNGELASFCVSRVGMSEMHITITGDGGMLVFDANKPDCIIYHHKEIDGGYTGVIENIQIEDEVFFSDWFSTQISHFVDVISGCRSDYPTLQDGLTVEKIVRLAKESASGGLFD